MRSAVRSRVAPPIVSGGYTDSEVCNFAPWDTLGTLTNNCPPIAATLGDKAKPCSADDLATRVINIPTRFVVFLENFTESLHRVALA